MNELARAFKKRYNRSIGCLTTIDTDTATNDITYRDAKFRITEYMKDGLTEYAEVEHNNRTNRFKTYLEAEIFVADKIGEM